MPIFSRLTSQLKACRYRHARWGWAVTLSSLVTMAATPSLADEARTERLCDWAVREMLTTSNPVTQNRAGFVASQLDCVLVPDAQLEAHILQGRTASIPTSAVGRTRPPWIVVGLTNVLLTMSGAAFVLALAMFASWWFRHRNNRSADPGA